MDIVIRENYSADLYGYAGVAVNRNWADTGMSLMNKMWQEVKSNHLKHKGINIWVYEEKDRMFAGVELETPPQMETTLELKKIHLPRYAYYKHVGPYNKIGETCSKVLNELNQKWIKTQWPYLEIYGHWTEDASKLETELLWCLL
ncbi:MAG TPA: hypothetical protein VFA55_06910 [Candidatus Kapabacteria bacterium]|nr:hypothetical protein [Candidatus Kapabacteria bacterium]